MYKKVGVLVSHITAGRERQLDLFIPDTAHVKHVQLMKAYDKVVARFGSQSLSYASAGVDPMWKAKRLYTSPHYTTNWHELVQVE